jgi:NADH-quinone oxidoreductase subunit J
MLTARGPFVSMQTSLGQWVLVGIVGAALLAVLLQAAVSVEKWAPQGAVAQAESAQPSPTAGPIGLGLLGVRVDRLDPGKSNPPEAASLAGYLLPFEVISVHLVVVLIGAAYLARARRRPGADPPRPSETT